MNSCKLGLRTVQTAIGLLLIPSFLFADVTLPKILSDNMVLQQGKPLTIWGNAAVGEHVSVSFGKQKKTAITGADGLWSTHLDPLPASPFRTDAPAWKPSHFARRASP